MEPNFNVILKEGCNISSSGTTGTPKQIYRDPDNLKACNEVAIEAQKITKDSSIYTCTRMTHAGGLLLQTLPAYTLGCDITIEKFNAYTFLKRFKRHTHTFIAPAMCEAVIQTKGFKQADLKGKFVAMGSDPIPAHHIQAFIDRGATVLANWGMSEIGPCVINKLYTPGDRVDHNIIGDTFWTDYKVQQNELYVKGPMCIYDDWFATGDLVTYKKKSLYYDKRK
jgi:acyl-CoA synthetase (AMP-forming)/AMP-acid ligase II